jgi:mRNA-degrading endonuclease RelE of RelBE toxin-antitoxin system
VRARVLLSSQVTEFNAKLAAEPRRGLRQAIKGIPYGRGDTKMLEGKLSGFHRLRSGRVRVVYHERVLHGQRQIYCLYADYRATVYDVFEQMLTSDLLEQFSE